MPNVVVGKINFETSILEREDKPMSYYLLPLEKKRFLEEIT